MINLITGTPGSGKTYLAIKDLTEKYFYWHKKDHCFYRKPESKKYEIFTNISELKLPHKNLTDIFRDQKLTFETFFTTEYQTKLHTKYPHIIYIIDECQQFIPFGFKNTATILYFDTHRHFGDKIYLITQDIKKITISIQSLVEIEYRAVKSTFTIFGGFRYNIKSSGDIFETKSCRKDKRIFNLYTSFQGDDQEIKTNYLKYYVVAGIIVFLGVGYYFYSVRLPALAKHTNKQPEQTLTEFKKDRISEVDKLSPEPTTDLKRIVSFPIENIALTENNQIVEYEDPITKKWFKLSNSPHKLIHSDGRYYIFISLRSLHRYQSDQNLLLPPPTTTTTTQNYKG